MGQSSDHPQASWVRDLRRHVLGTGLTSLAFPRPGGAMKGGSTPTSGRWRRPNWMCRWILDPDLGCRASETLWLIAPWQDSWVNMVFVDGRFSSSSISSRSGIPTGTPAAPVSGACCPMRSGSLQDHLGKYASVEDDGFIALNTAFLSGTAPALRSLSGPGFTRQVLNLVYLTTDRSQPKGHLPQNPGSGRSQQPGNGH